MKTTFISHVSWSFVLLALIHPSFAQTSITNHPTPAKMIGGISKATLVAEHDANQNGKIDAEEHAAYSRHVARLRKQEAKQAPVSRLRMTPQEKAFYQPPRFTPELVHTYDANKNGSLDPQERIAVEAAVLATARQELRKRDGNRDGKVDPQEAAAYEKADKPEGQPVRKSDSPTQGRTPQAGRAGESK